MPFWIRKEQKPRKFTLHFSQLCLSINLLHKTFAIVIYSESQWHLSEWELHWFALCRHVGDGTTYPVPPWCSSFVLRDVTPLLNLIANWFCFSCFIFFFYSYHFTMLISLFHTDFLVGNILLQLLLLLLLFWAKLQLLSTSYMLALLFIDPCNILYNLFCMYSVVLYDYFWFIYMDWFNIICCVTLINVISSNNMLNLYFENSLLDYMFYMFLTCMSIFMPVRCYLPFDL